MNHWLSLIPSLFKQYSHMTEYLQNGNLKDITHNSTSLKMLYLWGMFSCNLFLQFFFFNFYKIIILAHSTYHFEPDIFHLQQYID